MSNATTFTKTTDGYDVQLDGESIGSVSKKRQRTQVMANDRGLNYLIGHTERTAWAAYQPNDRRPTYHSTRKDAAYWLGFLAQQAR